MRIDQEREWLARCRQLIEENVDWGSAESWSTQDFERLSEEIADKTAVSLSVTTLKRVWGRVKYDSAPTATTLNTLARFIGYISWQHFKSTTKSLSSEVPSPRIDSLKAKSNRYVWFSTGWFIIAGAFVGLLGTGAFFLRNTKRQLLSYADFSFSSTYVATGIPNSVLFHYHAEASPTDSVFIQQSWDPSRRQRVPKNGHVHTALYYQPGYFRAKLIVGDQIVREQDLLIPSQGWHVAVLQEPVPVYFKAEPLIKSGRLSLPAARIQQQSISMQPVPPTVQYRYVKELGGLRSDNFRFETRVKSDYQQGSAICQRLEIMILCKNQYFAIPLSAKGCVGDLSLELAGHTVDATHTDLSGLGADLSHWVDVRCEVRQRHASVFVAGQKVYETDLPSAGKGIVGVGYEFAGTGSVDFVQFSQLDDTVVFEEDFNK